MADFPVVQSRRKSLVMLPRRKLSFMQIYSIAATARSKLQTEADRPEYNLRRLVAHANLLDLAMEDLQASRAQKKLCNHHEEELVDELLELEAETCSRCLLDESETMHDPEPIYDSELALVRTPSVPSLASGTESPHDTGHEQSSIQISSVEIISQTAIAEMLDSIENDLLDESSDGDEDDSDSIRARTSQSHHASSTKSASVEPLSSIVVKSATSLAVANPKVRRQRIPAAA